MAKKKEQVDFAQMSIDELKRRLVEMREKLFQSRFKNASGSLKNPLIIRSMRREVARLMTFVNQRGTK
jgi:large subunit ribosomal protein L29